MGVALWFGGFPYRTVINVRANVEITPSRPWYMQNLNFGLLPPRHSTL